LAVAFEGEYWRPTCPSCGVKLMDRKPRSGGQRFWGCANYPRCKYTQPMAQTAAGRRHGER
ncbi:MAG TPA: topoisomerase DNA-binding C4 zinc finger domain-containing protein, partial [Ottowia sp.]|nr:topoisomerase DNA-binding C4 zinc finger domain-containing protein [Ottowia sp.]